MTDQPMPCAKCGQAYWICSTYALILSLAGYHQGRVLWPTINLAFVAIWAWIAVRANRTTEVKS